MHAHTCTHSVALSLTFVLDQRRFLPHTLLPEPDKCFWVDCSTLMVQSTLFSHQICGRGIKTPTTLFPSISLLPPTYTSTSRLCSFFISFFICFFSLFQNSPKALLSVSPYISHFVPALSGGLYWDGPHGRSWVSPVCSQCVTIGSAFRAGVHANARGICFPLLILANSSTQWGLAGRILIPLWAGRALKGGTPPAWLMHFSLSLFLLSYSGDTLLRYSSNTW